MAKERWNKENDEPNLPETEKGQNRRIFFEDGRKTAHVDEDI